MIEKHDSSAKWDWWLIRDLPCQEAMELVWLILNKPLQLSMRWSFVKDLAHLCNYDASHIPTILVKTGQKSIKLFGPCTT